MKLAFILDMYCRHTLKHAMYSGAKVISCPFSFFHCLVGAYCELLH